MVSLFQGKPSPGSLPTMSLLTHQIVVPSKVSDVIDRSFTDGSLAHGFIWHLCPVVLAQEQLWVLVSAAVGYIQCIEHEISAEAVEEAVANGIYCNEPPYRERECVSVNLNPKAMTWRIGDQMPVHLATQLKRLQKRLSTCKDLCDADEAIMALNGQRLKIGNDSIKPREGMQGLMEELADGFIHYIDTTPFWKQVLDSMRGRHPWIDG